MHSLPGTAVTQGRWPYNDRNVFSYGSGGQKSKIKEPAGLCSFEGSGDGSSSLAPRFGGCWHPRHALLLAGALRRLLLPSHGLHFSVRVLPLLIRIPATASGSTPLQYGLISTRPRLQRPFSNKGHILWFWGLGWRRIFVEATFNPQHQGRGHLSRSP